MLAILNKLIPLLLKPLVITIISEELGLVVLRKKSYKHYLLCFVMNVFTNITMNILLQYLSNNYYLWLLVFEILVVVIEGLLYSILDKKIFVGIKTSLICNLISFIVGLLF